MTQVLYLIASCIITLMGIAMFVYGTLMTAYAIQQGQYRRTWVYLLVALLGIAVQAAA